MKLAFNMKSNEFCKIEVRHTLKRKKSFFVFSFQKVSHCVIISYVII